MDTKLFLHSVTYIVTPTVPTLEYYVHLSVITVYFNAFQRSVSTPASRTGRSVLYAKCHITIRVVKKATCCHQAHSDAPQYCYLFILTLIGRESAVGIATRYRLDDQGIEFLWGQDFIYPCRLAGPALFTVGTRSLFVG